MSKPKKPKAKHEQRNRKFIVKARITLTVCVEVSARTKAEALEEATTRCEMLTPLYNSIGENTEHPSMVEIDPDGVPGWFEEPDSQCGIFEGAEVFYK